MNRMRTIGSRKISDTNDSDLSVSFQNEFTNIFDSQNFSVIIPAHSGLVLNLGATDHFLRHFFLLDAFIKRRSPVFKSDVETYIGLIR